MTEPAVRRDLAATLGAYAVTGVAGLVSHAAIARTLGRAAFGVWVSSLALVYLLRVVTRFGGAQLVVRDGARDPGRLPGDVRLLVRLSAFATPALVMLAGTAALALGYGRTGVAVVALASLMVGADCVTEAFRAALHAHHRLVTSAVISGSVAAGSSAAILIALAAGGGVVMTAAASLLVSLAAMPVAAWVAAPHVAGGDRGDTRAFLRRLRPFAVAAALALGASNVDAVLVRTRLGAADAGAYGGPYRVFAALAWGAHAYASVLLPRLSRASAGAPETYPRLARAAAARAAATVAPLAVAGALLAGQIVPIVFGAGYADAVAPMRVLFLALPATYAAVVLRQALLSCGRATTAARILGGALAANIAANLLFLDRFGIIAAATITLATDAFVTAAALRALARPPAVPPVITDAAGATTG